MSSIFKKAEHSQAYLKAGFLGLQSSGKTYTATELAIGLILYARSKGIESANRPAAFFDTETGSDWMLPRFQEAGIELIVSRSRSLSDLGDGMHEAAKDCSLLLIDSITHYWTKFVDEYCVRFNRRFGLEVWDWSPVKREWRTYFADPYVNLPLHIIMCGRQGYEYETEVNESTGKKETNRSGIKMKAESETGFEPSILIAMEQDQVFEHGELQRVDRLATVIKDRSTLLDGKQFRNPVFKDFLPHIERLTLGGHHEGISGGDNRKLFTSTGESQFTKDKREKDIVLEEIAAVMKKHHSGQDKASKDVRGDLMEKHFGTRAWGRVETLDLNTLQAGRNSLWVQLEGVPYAFVPPTQPAEVVTLDGDDKIPQEAPAAA